MFLCTESFSIAVSGVVRFRLSGSLTATDNILWTEDSFVTTDTFGVTIASAVHSQRPQTLLGCIDLDYKPIPTAVYWTAYLIEGRVNAGSVVVWATSGTAKSSNGSSTFEFGITGPFLGHAGPSREQGPSLSLVLNYSDSEPLTPPPLGSILGGTPLTLNQSLRDALRQEYINFGSAWIPTHGDIVDLLKPFNTGNYSTDKVVIPVEMGGGGAVPPWGIGISNGFEAKLNAVKAAYRGRPVVVGPDKPEALHLLNGLVGEPLVVNGSPVFIPNDDQALFRIASAYRNPRRNVAVGSKYPVTSKHVLGRALDLVPLPISGVKLDGGTVPLLTHRHLFPTLLQAARSVAPSSIGEDGATPVPIGDHSEDHVHVQW